MLSKYKIEILTPAFNDINQIAEYHLLSVGPTSAERITDKLLVSIEGRVIDDTVYIYRVVHGATDYPKLFE